MGVARHGQQEIGGRKLKRTSTTRHQLIIYLSLDVRRRVLDLRHQHVFEKTSPYNVSFRPAKKLVTNSSFQDAKQKNCLTFDIVAPL
jgi:hypothetical protein